MGVLTAAIFAHAESAACFSDEALVGAMVRFEIALAEVQADLGLIPKASADSIATLEPLPAFEILHDGAAKDGVPVPALVSALRAALPPEHADWLHYGATSQDVIDCAMMLCCKDALAQHQRSLSAAIDKLQGLALAHRATPMLGRTRGQLATPITFGLRLAQWAQPLIGLENAPPNAFRVQFGGASGSNSATAPHGPAIAADLARRLGLPESPPWHTDRTGLQSLAAWLEQLAVALGKIGVDVALLSRNEIMEAAAGAAGSSSTMPHKANPVTAEALQAASRAVLSDSAGLRASAIHAEERDGVSWAMEWLFLPRLFIATGAALTHATTLIETLQPEPEIMRARIDTVPETLAEAAVFSLAPTVGRAEAYRIVRAALADIDPLPEALEKYAPRIDWTMALDLTREMDAAAQVAAQIFSARSSQSASSLT